ncbi:MAG: T9SS type A sorting domain-containing protein [Candidatus Marinimicrobia bacterium]|nr:T9SS type A sorting domain-containing protein [Candidatus Neomarinimicrobiota bacterium]MCF7827406.1 T9SS type A sorting domain-containing protein [Candidatus Neomarinimicrobiota bacterium]MCF7881361.1 T9SS type A sorting domain-containing protein [Candidatus Neomarinimicrobiota bacterium]
MKFFRLSVLCAVFIGFAFNLSGAETADIIVAKDGSGDYSSVQGAINSIPVNNSSMKIILVKNGDYEEQVLIEKDNITLVGEDRENTRIYANMPRPDDGFQTKRRAPISIYAQNIILANMTIENTQTERGIHAFTVYGGGDELNRIMTINCNILSYGGDTMALWNEENGMYYHRDINLRGAVDFLCPRGWAYAENIDFEVTRETAVLWHQGSEDRNQKFVVKNSTFSAFDGNYDYDLGRHHYDAHFYLLNNTFSERMKDKPIYRAEPDDAYQWPDRNYFYNNTKEGEDYEWFRNNIQEAEGRPTPGEITPEWTFDNQWNPREWMPAVLPFTDWPMPADSAVKVGTNPELTWKAGRNAMSHNVYFGTSEDPAFHSNVSGTSFSPGELQPNTEYFWRVDAVSEDDTVEGEVWHFHTQSDQAPPKATSPIPANGGTIDPPVKAMTWEMDSLSADTAKLYLGSDPESLSLVNTYTTENYDPEPLTIGETYYWRVDLVNHMGVTTGDVWEFTLQGYGYTADDVDYTQEDDDNHFLVVEAEQYSDSTIIGEYQWEVVDSVEGFSGWGAVQIDPSDGRAIYHQLMEKSSRLDYIVNFVTAGTHYIWVRQYNPNDDSQFIHMGLNHQELDNAKQIGRFDTLGVWEWAQYNNVPADYYTPVRRTFDVKSKGIQSINLWFGEAGTIVDKIVLTTNPDYTPTGKGPGATTGIQDNKSNGTPETYRLMQNYPNPFNARTALEYTLPKESDVTLRVYDLRGQVVYQRNPGQQQAGTHRITVNASDWASGIYFCVLSANNFQQRIKMVLLK